jgi:hypothetical protein
MTDDVRHCTAGLIAALINMAWLLAGLAPICLFGL